MSKTNPDGRTRVVGESSVMPMMYCQVVDCHALAIPVEIGKKCIAYRAPNWDFQITIIMCQKHTAIVMVTSGVEGETDGIK